VMLFKEIKLFVVTMGCNTYCKDKILR
jgi:hypothetical protein